VDGIVVFPGIIAAGTLEELMDDAESGTDPVSEQSSEPVTECVACEADDTFPDDSMLLLVVEEPDASRVEPDTISPA
jgi:hypothetical protein